MQPFVYQHCAQYYETDQMGIIHHSNYIRWMESARVAYLDHIGLPYREMEEAGIVSPVLAVSCEYKSMVRFCDCVDIEVRITEYNGVKLSLAYRITDHASGALRTVAESRHCFLTRAGRPVALNRSFPEWDRRLREAAQAGPKECEP